jgi:ankyrin repeat protein
MGDKISNPQLKNDAEYFVRSIKLLQIAIAIYVVLPLVYPVLNILIFKLLGSDLLLSGLMFACEVIILIASGLVLVGVWRIIHLLKSEIWIFYSLAAIVTFAFFCSLKGLDLWHSILISCGGGYRLSELRQMGLLILPPLGIISCCAIALRANLHFRLFQDGSKRIYILSTVIGLTWLLGIILASAQWWQNRETIEFEWRYLVIFNLIWQQQSRFGKYYGLLHHILPLPWQIWLYISLHSARRRLRGFHEGFSLPKDEQNQKPISDRQNGTARSFLKGKDKKRKFICLIVLMAIGILVALVTYNLITVEVPPSQIVRDLRSEMDSMTPLHRAARDGRTDDVKHLLKSGADVDCRSFNGMTPLHYAVCYCRKETAEFLISSGADVNAKDNRGSTPLHWVGAGGREDAKEVVSLLLSRGAGINDRNNEGRTPLHRAALTGDPNLVGFLIANGADVDAKDIYGFNVLDKPRWRGLKEVAEVLIKHGAIDTSRLPESEISIAVRAGDIRKVESILATKPEELYSKDYNGNTLLHEASIEGDKEMVAFLLAKGAEVDAKADNGETPLHWAAGRRHAESWFNSWGQDWAHTEVIKLLISNGANVNAKSNWGRTPLDAAVTNGNRKAAKILRKHGGVTGKVAAETAKTNK